MLVTVAIVLFTVTLVAVCACLGLRFPGKPRDKLLHLCGWLQGLDTRVVYDVEQIVAVLSHGEDKGRSIEETLMLPVWTEAASVESVNGRQWRALRSAFNAIHSQLPPLATFEQIMLRLDVAAVAGRRSGLAAKAVADSPLIARLTVLGFTEYVLGRKAESELVEALLAAMPEIRGELAMRQRGRDDIKRAANKAVIQAMERSAYRLPEGRSWSERDVFPAVMQPFFISPAINFVDIFIALDALCPTLATDKAAQWKRQGFEAARADIEAHLLEAMRLKHPFPVLERLHGRTQYFMPLDSLYTPGTPEGAFRPDEWLRLGGSHPGANVPFGVGPRRCPGRPIALAGMSALLYNLLTTAEVEFKPALNHRHSGRIHDDAPSPFAEQLYGFSRIAYAIFVFAFFPRTTEM